MLKYSVQFSFILIIYVNCGIIRRELSNNEAQTNLKLLNIINNDTTTNPTSLNVKLKDVDDDLILVTTDFSTTKELHTEINLNTENKIELTTKIDNLNQFSTTTELSLRDETSTTKSTITTEPDDTTEIKIKDSTDIFKTTGIISTTNENFITTTKKFDINEGINLYDKTKNISENNVTNSILNSKTSDQLKDNQTIHSTELYYFPTATSKSLVHQIKLDKKYDIVTNEIGNSTILNSAGNTKPAKPFKENTVNSKDLTIIDAGEVNKNIKDNDEKLKYQYHTESTLEDSFSTTSTSITFTTDSINTLKNNIKLFEQTTNDNVETHLPNGINNLNNINISSSKYVDLTTSTDVNKDMTSTTDMTIATTTNLPEIITSTKSKNYTSTTIINFTKNKENMMDSTEGLSKMYLSTTEENFTTENITDDLLSTSTETEKTDTLNSIIENQNSLTTGAYLLTTNPMLTTSNDNDLKTTTPNNVILISTASSPEPESSIETNSIEKTEKSTMGSHSNTTPYLINITISTKASPKLADILEDTITTTTISSSTISPKIQKVPKTSSSIDNDLNNSESSYMKPITESSLNSSHTLEIEEMERSNNEADYNVIIAISVSIIGIVALILLVGFLYVMRKRQKQLTYVQRCRPVSLDAYSLDNVSVYNSVRRKAALRASKRSYGNAAFDDPALIHNNLSINDLFKFVEKKSVIYEEFKGIPQIIARTDEVPPGCEDKNRYANVIPLPETRVVLQQLENDEKTEYINANFVRGPKDSPNYYIACQAPLEGTVVDFWRMIWEQNSRVIIMATDLIENGIEKCTEYLPASIILDNHINFGDYQITLKNREVKEKYAVSVLHLKNMNNNLNREITHFWYKWPETGVPSDQPGIIAMLLEARSCLKVANTDQIDNTITAKEKIINRNSNGTSENNKEILKTQGPLVIHCSPGTGRTGTITCIDIALRSLETTKHVDIPQIVYYVRRGRASSVQTTEQYEFIYKVVNVYATKISGTANDN